MPKSRTGPCPSNQAAGATPAGCAAAPPMSPDLRLTGLRISVGGVAHEAGLLLLEPQLDLTGRPVSMLGQTEVDHLAVLLLIVLTALPVAPQEHHQIGILLDRAGLAQVGQSWLL